MTEIKRIGIVGYGYVGKAMAAFFRPHYDVIAYDPAYPELASTTDVNACDLAVVCVPTPQRANGACDTSSVKEVIGWLETPLILLKSTVPPGTTSRLVRETGKSIVFSPEYCGESTYWSPYAWDREIKETPFFIFGGDPVYTSAMIDVFLKVTGPVKTYRQTTSRAAEMAKYVTNTFAALKIAYCYEVATLCEKVALDFNEVRELWLLDPRVNPMHTAVFAGNEKPFGGKCLPKDLSGLVQFARENGYDPELLAEVQSSNDRLGRVRARSR